MIVTLATQIIFRGIAEVTLGAGGSIAITNTDGSVLSVERLEIFHIFFSWC